jgi:hypothetical protein
VVSGSPDLKSFTRLHRYLNMKQPRNRTQRELWVLRQVDILTFYKCFTEVPKSGIEPTVAQLSESMNCSGRSLWHPSAETPPNQPGSIFGGVFAFHVAENLQTGEGHLGQDFGNWMIPFRESKFCPFSEPPQLRWLRLY